MQKKLIALAIAGLSGAAFAQSNVTIYGVMDGTYDNVSATGATNGAAGNNYQSRGRTTMNSSYVGFKGVESLGNGLAVAFQVETAVGENAGATNTVAGSTYGWANRDTYVGLAGGFGTIAFGNLTAPARALGAAMDVNSGATGIGANTALLGKFFGGSGAGYFDQRFSNAIAYISPTMGGFSGVLAYVPNENRGKDVASGTAQTNTTGWTLGLNYNNGPIMVGYAWTQIKDADNNNVAGSGLALTTGIGAANIVKATNNRLAAKYNFGAGTVGLMWDQNKATAAGAAAADYKGTGWFLPVTFNVGSGKIIGQYGKVNNPSGTLVAAGTDYSAKQFTLGYEYSMSKRTILKAVYSQITNSTNATYDFLYGVSAPNTTGPGAGVSAGADPRGISIGLRHSF
ncbi:MAG TPA: porin [Rhodocyclaceae bacterium]